MLVRHVVLVGAFLLLASALNCHCLAVRHSDLQQETATVLECDADTITQAGEYVIVGDPNSLPASCSVLVLADLNENIEISVTEANFNCSLDPYYALMFDGVHFSDAFFPPMANNPSGRKEQFKAVCDDGNKEVVTYRTSTNVLTVTHTLADVDGVAMRFHIRFVHNHNPCNVVAARAQGMHVLQSVGSGWQNCSMLLLQPALIALDSLRIGHQRMLDSILRSASNSASSSRLASQNTLSSLGQSCSRISKDILQVTPFPFDWNVPSSAIRLCGDLRYPVDDVHRYAISTCGAVTVNLQSSGRFRNRATISWYEPQTEESVSDVESTLASNAEVAKGQCLSLSRTNMADYLGQ